MANTPATLPALVPWAPAPDLAWLPSRNSPSGPRALVEGGTWWDAARVPVRIARPASAVLDLIAPDGPGAVRAALDTAVNGVPTWSRLSERQIRGVDCVRCGTTPGDAPIPFPPQPCRFQGRPSRWYPRACPGCVG